MKAVFYTQQDVDKIVKKEKDRMIRRTIEFCQILTAWAVWDTVPDVTAEMVQAVLTFMDGKSTDFISTGEVCVSDIADMLKEETGIVMHFDKEYFR